MLDTQVANTWMGRAMRGAALARLFSGVGLLLVALTFSACSGCSDEEDKCEGKTCERGVCGPDTGLCINAKDCAGADDKCIDGYSCTAANVCQADYPCTGTGQGTCQSGQCIAGACVDKESCAADVDCAPGNFCGEEGVCKSDPCADGTTTCERGVCQKGTGVCVNEVVCTEANEQDACIDGFKCSGQKCVNEQEFCAGLTCARGVCDFATLACADAVDCGGDDTKCLEGDYCTAQNKCEPNQCDANMTMCPRGVCDQMSGACVDKATCSTSNDCLDGKLCVGDQCVAEAEACGAAGCPGNQLCEYDAGTRSAACAEDTAAGCTSALDCADDRICRGGACTAPVACEADALEPNDDAATATDYLAAATGGLINNATICAGNKDFFTYNTRQDPQALGLLVVEINYNPQDVGLGTLNLELFDKNGASVGTAVADAQGRARLETPVTVITQGDFVVAVGDEGDVKASGIRYTLFTDVIDTSVIQACQMARALTSGVTINSSTTSGASTVLTSSCGDAAGNEPEDIFSITVATPSYVTIEVVPDAMADLSVSLRQECLRNGSELPRSCSERGGVGVTETFGALLAPGTYYAVVQGPAPQTGGFYDITATIEPAICSSADDSCKNATTASVCNDRGTAFVDEACDTGCNMNTGRCNRPAGDVCVEAISVSVGQDYAGQVEWGGLRNDYSLAAGGCIDTATPPTDGPDLTFKVDVPANYAVEAVLGAAGQDVALYGVFNCGDLNNSCELGVDESALSDETFFWINPNPTTTTIYLIADIKSAQTYQPSNISIKLQEVICTPGQAYCTTDMSGDPASHVCNVSGTDYEDLTTCAFGCDMATGLCNRPTNDTCDGAIALTAGVPVTGLIEDYTASYPFTTSACTGFASDGEDAVYKITLNAGEILDVTLDSTFDSALWISNSCDAMTAQIGQCVAGTDDEILSAPEQLTFRAPTTGDYFIIAQAFDAGETGSFTLTAEVRIPECVPGSAATCKDATTLTYCDAIGFFQDYTCNGACSSGACTTPTGDVCVDSFTLTGTSGQVTGTFANATNSFEYPAGQTGGCFIDDFDENEGLETFYRVSLNAGEVFTATLNTTSTTAFLFFIEGGCGGVADQCVRNNPNMGSTTQTYYAAQATELIVIVDNNSSFTSTAFTMDWSVSVGTCAPDQFRCIDAMTLGKCAADGLSETSTPCALGCQNGACAVDIANADTCAAASAAADVGAGIAVYSSYDRLTNDVDMPSSGSCAGGQQTDGNDLLYKVVLQPGEILHAWVDSYGDEPPLVYAFADCMDPSGTCVGGGREIGTTNRAELYYANQSMVVETLIVGADNEFNTADEAFGFFIEKRAPECQPGTTICAADGATLQLCNSFGLYDRFTCNGTCTTNACDTPSGDVCFDSFTLTGTSGQATGDFATGTNKLQYQTGQTGGCFLDAFDENDGRDTFYRVSLNAGEVFTATLNTTSTTAYLFFIEGTCSDVSSTCTKNNPNFGTPTLSYYAAQATSLIVVVDNTSTSTTSTPFTLNWRIDAGRVCAPDQFRCIDANNLGRCATDGLSETAIPCALGCQDDACVVDIANADTCAAASAAPDVGTGLAVYGNYDDLTNDVDMPSAGSCAGGQQTDGADLLYKVVLQPGEILHAWVDSYGDEPPLVYAFADCMDPSGTCVGGGREIGTTNRAELYYANQSMVAETLIVGADNEFSTADAPFGFFIEKRAPECQPGTNICAADGTTLQLCNSFGLYDRYACNGTCTANACDNPSGDVCFDSFTLTGTSGQATGDFAAGTNRLEYSTGQIGGCFLDDFDQNDGRDTFYRVSLNAGEVFTATLNTTSTTAYLFFIEGTCSDVSNTCTKNNPNFGTPTLSYYAAQATSLIVVVDNTSTSTTSTPFTLDWRIDAGRVCAPDQFRCIDAMTLGKCAADGSSEASIICALGCQDGACLVDIANADTCAAASAAPDVGTGLAVYGNYDDLTNDVDMPSSGSCAGGQQTDGNDLLYKVVLQPGEILHAWVDSYGDEPPLVYAFADCMDPSGTCVGGGREIGTTNRAELYYANQSMVAETLIVGADNEFGTADEAFGFFIEKRAPECQPGTNICAADGTTLQLCNGFGLYDRFTCNGTCTGNACDNPSGEVCFDAKVLAGPSGQVTGDFQGGRDFDPGDGRFGGCFVDDFDNPDGGDTFYRVNLQAGDVFEAKLTTNSTTAHMFLFSDCTGANSCLKNLPFQGNGTLTYYAPTAQSVTLVVDNSSTFTTATNTYTVDYTIRTGLACAPQTFRCVDATTLGRCATDGLSEVQSTCAAGCADGACVDVTMTSDLCADTAAGVDIGQGIAVYSSYDDHTNDIDMASTSCVGQQTDGNDTFYKVIVQPGEILHAWVDSYGDEDPQVYAIRDCADPENTCVAGAPEFGLTNRAEIYYVNQTMAAETLIVAADGEFNTSDEPFGFFIEKLAPQCQQGAVQCAGDGTTLLTCNQYGLFERYACNGACSAGACVNPSGNACFDAIPVSGAMGQLTGNFNNSNLYALGAGQTGGCFIDDFDENDESDTFYSVALNAGDVLDVQLRSANSASYLFLLADCTDPASCLKNNPQRGNTSLSYYAPVAQTIYIVVDSSATSAATYTVDYTITAAQICAAGEFRCVDATTLGKCSPDGLMEAQLTCAAGCEFGACKLDVANNDTCLAANMAPDVGDGIAVYASYAGLTNDIDMPSSACVGTQTDGRDMFYKVTLQPGEVVHAWVDSYGDESPLVYAIRDCADPVGTCAAGERETGTTNRAELYYANATMAPETLIIGADSELTTPDEPFGFFIERRQPECQPMTNICDASGNNRLSCNDAGIYETTACALGCTNGACNLPTNDTCTGATALTSGVPASGVIDLYNSDYPLTSTACTGFTTTGRDALYKITVPAGRSVDVTLTTSFDGSLWVANSCNTMTAMIGQCIAGEDSAFSGGTEALTFVAPTAGDYYIVAQAYSSTGLGDFTVTATIRP